MSKSPASTQGGTTTVIETRIWRHAQAPNAYFLDISKIPNLTDAQHFSQILTVSYKGSDFYGIKTLGRANNRYVELNPKPEILEKFISEGVYYPEQKIRLLPCKAIEGDGNIIQINLTYIPFLPPKDIVEGLTKTLSKFGTVLDIGLKFQVAWHAFMGAGYAVLQDNLDSDSKLKLSHTLTWADGINHCFATFPDMPTWCRYCHEEGHTKYACPKSAASITCYACDKTGHRQADCPEPAHRRKKPAPYKKPRKSPLPAANNASGSTQDLQETGPSDLIIQSRWAPQPVTEAYNSANNMETTQHDPSTNPVTEELAPKGDQPTNEIRQEAPITPLSDDDDDEDYSPSVENDSDGESITSSTNMDIRDSELNAEGGIDDVDYDMDVSTAQLSQAPTVSPKPLAMNSTSMDKQSVSETGTSEMLNDRGSNGSTTSASQ